MINLFLIFLLSPFSFSQLTTDLDLRQTGQLAKQTLSKGYSYAALPFIKEQLITQDRSNKVLDDLVDQISSKVGIEQFEYLDEELLKRSNSTTLTYLRAKKAFNRGDHKNSLSLIKKIEKSKHFLSPSISYLFSLNLIKISKYQIVIHIE